MSHHSEKTAFIKSKQKKEKIVPLWLAIIVPEGMKGHKKRLGTIACSASGRISLSAIIYLTSAPVVL